MYGATCLSAAASFCINSFSVHFSNTAPSGTLPTGLLCYIVVIL